MTGGRFENLAVPVPPSRNARQRGLIGYRDRAQRTHFGLSPRFGAAHLTADALFDGVLRQRLLSLGEPGFLLLSLVFDGVVDPDCMQRAWQAVPTVYRCADGVCLDWLDHDGRLQRRLLGPLSVLALGACRHRGSFDAASSQLVAALSAQDAFGPDLNAVLSIARTRLATALPGDLLAHVIGDHPLNAVQRSCLARLHTKLALVGRSSHSPGDAGLNNSVQWQVADAAFPVAHAGDPQEASSLLRAIGNACRADSTEPNPAVDRRRMARQLEAQAPACIAVGGWVCMLLLSRKLFPRIPVTQFCDVGRAIGRIGSPGERSGRVRQSGTANEDGPGIPGRGACRTGRAGQKGSSPNRGVAGVCIRRSA